MLYLDSLELAADHIQLLFASYLYICLLSPAALRLLHLYTSLGNSLLSSRPRFTRLFDF